MSLIWCWPYFIVRYRFLSSCFSGLLLSTSVKCTLLVRSVIPLLAISYLWIDVGRWEDATATDALWYSLHVQISEALFGLAKCYDWLMPYAIITDGVLSRLMKLQPMIRYLFDAAVTLPAPQLCMGMSVYLKQMMILTLGPVVMNLCWGRWYSSRYWRWFSVQSTA